MKDPKIKEIGRVLMGRAVVGEDGLLYPIPAGTFMKTPLGIGDGTASVRFFGVSHRARSYTTKDSRTRVEAAAKKAMQNVGRGLVLSEQPGASACLIRYILTRPAVLTFSWEDGAPVLTAWTGRGLTGWLSMRRAIKAFEKSLPDTMLPHDVKPVKKDEKQRKAEKERRKAEKEQRKAERKQRKEEKKQEKQQRKEEKERDGKEKQPAK